MVRFLPPDANVPTILRGTLHWSVEAHLLDDLRMVWTGDKKTPPKPHPQRPLGKEIESPERLKKITAARRRARARRARREGHD